MTTIHFLFAGSTLVTPVLVIGVVALLLGTVIVITAKYFAVPVDEKLETVTSMLPGANCGGCGYSGCSGYAEALASGKEKDVTRCSVGGAETAEELSRFLGYGDAEFIPKVAHIYCKGTNEYNKQRYEYKGTRTCASANGVLAGPNSCAYGCLGFGDCMRVCEYGAIYLENGIAHIDSTKCTACTKCVAVCPKRIIHIIPKHWNAYTVKCSNPLPGALTRKSCGIGCIGCTKCKQVCEHNAITMKDSLAVIDQSLCTHCGACIKVCPTNAICNGLERGLGQPSTAKVSSVDEKAAV